MMSDWHLQIGTEERKQAARGWSRQRLAGYRGKVQNYSTSVTHVNGKLLQMRRKGTSRRKGGWISRYTKIILVILGTIRRQAN